MALINYLISMKPAQPTLYFRLTLEQQDGVCKLRLTESTSDLVVDFVLDNTQASTIAKFLTLGLSEMELKALGRMMAEKANEKLRHKIREIDLGYDISNLLKQNFDIAGCTVSAAVTDVALDRWDSKLMFGGTLNLE